jgi:hypothetical protein
MDSTEVGYGDILNRVRRSLEHVLCRVTMLLKGTFDAIQLLKQGLCQT